MSDKLITDEEKNSINALIELTQNKNIIGVSRVNPFLAREKERERENEERKKREKEREREKEEKKRKREQMGGHFSISEEAYKCIKEILTQTPVKTDEPLEHGYVYYNYSDDGIKYYGEFEIIKSSLVGKFMSVISSKNNKNYKFKQPSNPTDNTTNIYHPESDSKFERENLYKFKGSEIELYNALKLCMEQNPIQNPVGGKSRRRKSSQMKRKTHKRYRKHSRKL